MGKRTPVELPQRQERAPAWNFTFVLSLSLFFLVWLYNPTGDPDSMGSFPLHLSLSLAHSVRSFLHKALIQRFLFPRRHILYIFFSLSLYALGPFLLLFLSFALCLSLSSVLFLSTLDTRTLNRHVASSKTGMHFLQEVKENILGNSV